MTSHYPDFIKTALQSIIEEEDIKNAKIINNCDAGKAGDGYISTMYKITLEGSNKTLDLIVKRACDNIEVRKTSPLKASFDSEIYIYDKVMPIFYKLQEDKFGINKFSLPKCYKLSKEDLKEFLIFENMRQLGYEQYDRMRPIDSSHVEFVLKEFANLHSLSFALKDQQPKLFFKLAAELGDSFNTWLAKGGLFQMLDILAKRNKSLIEEESNKFYKAFVQLSSEMEQMFLDYNYKDDKYAIITHTDCWINNMLFKYEVKSGEKTISKMTLLDFQLSRCFSFVGDLTLFLYSCCDEKIWNELYKYLDLYYSTLCTNLQELGSDPNKIMPKNAFYEEYKRYAYYGLITAGLWIRINLMEEDEAPKLEDGENFTINFTTEKKNENEYKDRYKKLLSHFNEHNFLENFTK